MPDQPPPPAPDRPVADLLFTGVGKRELELPISQAEDDGSEDPPKSTGGRNVKSRHQTPVFIIFWILCFLLTAAPAFSWHGWRGILILIAGLTMVFRPPVFRLPWIYPVLATATLLLSCLVFLPAGWIHQPAWRPLLEAAGLPLSPYVTIQPASTLESLSLFCLCLVIQLYLLGHRVNHGANHILALCFSMGVAVIALFSIGDEVLKWRVPWDPEDTFGPFPNRNHMATLLVMGIMTGTGVAVQSLRVRTWSSGIAALVSVAISVWAIIGHSISRAGIILLMVMFALWMLSLGRTYLRGKVLIAAVLIAGAAVIYFVSGETKVKTRLDLTSDHLTYIAGGEAENAALWQNKTGAESLESLDDRLPIFLETLDMLRHEPWTGVGAGQFTFVFPQYRIRSSVDNHVQVLHPESDWLLLATEHGLAAAICFALLLMIVGGKALAGALQGRARALRAGCLAAAAAVPIHGIIDVPGHRMELVWCSLWLVALTIRVDPGPDSNPRAPIPEPDTAGSLGRWSFRLAGIAIMTGGALLIHSQWLGGRTPAALLQEKTLDLVQTFYQKEQMELAAATGHSNENSKIAAGGTDPANSAGSAMEAVPPAFAGQSPATSQDNHEHPLSLVEKALETFPMDPHLQYLKAAIAVGLEGKETETQIGFNLAVLLDPSSVSMPLHVAESRAQFETGEIPRLWTEAMKRSGAREKLDPLVSENQRNTFAHIMSLCAKYPELTSEAVKLAAGRPESPLLLKTWAASANGSSLDIIMPGLLAAPDLPATSIPELGALWLKRGTTKQVEVYLKQEFPHLEWGKEGS